MNWKRLSLGLVIGVAAGVSAVYLMSVWLELPTAVVSGLSALTIAVTAWMAIRILKDPRSTDKTFGDQFYQERDDIRRSGKE